MTSEQSQPWIIDRFENGKAVLKVNGQELVLPRSCLPKESKEGDVLAAEFYFLKDEKIRRENVARALLKEILGEQG